MRNQVTRLESVRTVFVHGMDAALLVSAGIAVVGMLLALAFMPWRRTAVASPAQEGVIAITG